MTDDAGRAMPISRRGGAGASRRRDPGRQSVTARPALRIVQPAEHPFAARIRQRGIVPLYRPGCHCPACGGQAWLVGRTMAECARCAMALPMAREGAL